ncbi:MAG: Egg lysin [Rhizobium sp. 63-7]|nr:MAG: Egg lysin [Rhizobium sp. 63-7]
MSKGSFAFPGHPERAVALGEIHARPYVLVRAPRVIFQLAFMAEGGLSVHHAVISEMSRSRGVSPRATDARHHALACGPGTLRWERHTEFSTWFWDGPAPEQFGGEVAIHPFGDGFSPPGSLMSGIRLEIRPDGAEARAALKTFDPASLCHSEVKSGSATILTDFRQDGDGLTRILIIDRGLTEAGTGALVQRLLDIETYRTLAMLGLPLAQSLSPEIRRIEDGLTAVTQRMKAHAREEADTMLGEITRLAAELEANAALSLYRFGASRAYDDIVRERVKMLDETPVPGFETLGSFLQRRLAPAMRTCQSVEERQANLSRKLSRATGLVRSWIDVELERQNSVLLTSMDRRANLQLRLQQTVEGLSVAAISYYVVGLFGYLAKWLETEGFPIKSSTLTGLSVPVVILGIWWTVRRIRHHHRDTGD